DQLHLREIRRAGGKRRGLVGWHLELLARIEAELLGIGRQCPIVEALRLLQIACALDDRHRSDLETGALAGRVVADRESGMFFRASNSVLNPKPMAPE